MVGWDVPEPLRRILYWRPEDVVMTSFFFAFSSSHALEAALEPARTVLATMAKREVTWNKKLVMVSE